MFILSSLKIIDESDTVTYLGHILCNSGKDDKVINTILGVVYCSTRRFYFSSQLALL